MALQGIPILWMRDLGLWEAKELAENHENSKVT